MRIFLVADDSSVVGSLSEILRAEGYLILGSAAFGEHTVELIPKCAQDQSPDLVLMDIRVGGELNAIAVAQALRSRCDIPIVFLTSDHDRNMLNRACATMPYGILTTPIEPGSVVPTLEAALARRRHEMAANTVLLATAAVDKLTGLPNRRHFLRQWNGACDNTPYAAVCVCEIDGLKTLDGTQNSDCRDRALRRFACRLRGGTHPPDLVCRADTCEPGEFYIVFFNTTVAEAADRLRAIGSAFEEELSLEGVAFKLSFGISLLRAGEDTIEAALHKASHRLSDAKQLTGSQMATEDDTSTNDLFSLYRALGSSVAGPDIKAVPEIEAVPATSPFRSMH